MRTSAGCITNRAQLRRSVRGRQYRLQTAVNLAIARAETQLQVTRDDVLHAIDIVMGE